MTFNFKNIHIGECIKGRVDEMDISIIRICNFFNTTEEEVCKMFEQKSLDAEILLKWSKLLKYDFFRIYSQHLIMFAPQASIGYNSITKKKDNSLPQFRKNAYTKEVIDFILELINTGQKTKLQIIQDYKIPKTTLYKWINKYNGSE